MKKKVISSVIATGLVAAAPFAFSGCMPKVTEHSFYGHNAEYSVNDTFSIEGMKLKLVMSDGEIREVTITESMVKQMPDMSTPGKKYFVVEYKNKEYVLTIDVVGDVVDEDEDDEADAQSLTSVNGLTTSYFVGDSIILASNAKLRYVKASGSIGEVPLTSGMISNFSTTEAGTYNMTISYKGKTLQVEYTVMEVEVQAITSVTGVKDEYFVGDVVEFSSNAVVNFVNNNGTTDSVKFQSSMLTEFSTSTPGEHTAIITYEGVEFYFIYRVAAIQAQTINEVNGIEVYYVVGDSLNLSKNATISVTFNNGKTQNIPLTADMISNFSTTAAGTKLLTITYQGKTKTVEYHVATESDEELKQLLNEFLVKYKDQSKVGNTSATITVDSTAQFFKESASFKDTFGYDMDEENLPPYAKPLYDSIISGIVESSMKDSEIVDISGMKAKLSALKAMKNVYNNLEEVDFYDLIVNELILTESNEYYATKINQYLTEAFDLNANGQDLVVNQAKAIINSIRNKQEIDILDELETLKETIVQNSSDQNFGVNLINQIEHAVEEYMEVHGTQHALSYAIKECPNLFIHEVWDENEENYVIIHNSDVSKAYAEQLSSLVYEIESLIDSESKSTTILNIIEILESGELCDHNETSAYEELYFFNWSAFTNLWNAAQSVLDISLSYDIINKNSVDFLRYARYHQASDIKYYLEQQLTYDFKYGLGLNEEFNTIQEKATEFVEEYIFKENASIVGAIDFLINIATDAEAIAELQTLKSFAQSYIQVNGTEHAWSATIAQSTNLVKFKFKPELREEAIEYRGWFCEDYARNLSDIVRSLENLKAGKLYTSSLNTISMASYYLASDLNYTYYYLNSTIEEWLYYGLEERTDNTILVLAATVGDIRQIKTTLVGLAEEYGLNSEAVAVVCDYVKDMYLGNTHNNVQYITDFCAALDIDSTPFLEEYNLTGTCQMVTMAATSLYEQYEDNEYCIATKNSAIELAKYVDSILNGEFDFATLMSKLNTFAVDSYDYLSETDDDTSIMLFTILSDLTSYGADYKGMISYVADILEQVAIPEGAIVREVLTSSMYPEFDCGDMITIEPANTYVVGDIIHFESYIYEVAHRIIGIVEENGEIYYITHGDFVASANPENGVNRVDWQDDANYIQGLINEGKTLDEIMQASQNVQAVSIYNVNGKVTAVNQHSLPIPAEIISIVKNFLISDYTDADVEILIADVCEYFDIDSTQYVANYREHGTCYILEDLVDQFISRNDFVGKELTMYEKLKDVAKAADEIFAGKFDAKELIEKINVLAKASLEYTEDTGALDENVNWYRAMYYATLLPDGFKSTLDTAIEDFSHEIKDVSAEMICNVLKLEVGSKGYYKVYDLLTIYLNKYLKNGLTEEDLGSILDEYFEIVDEYCDEDVQVYAKAISVMIGALTYEQGTEIDYNKVFGFIPLPDSIEEIDYNVLIEQLANKETYNCIKIEDVQVQYVTEGDEIVKEILTMNYSIDFELTVLAKVEATGTITLEIEF